MEWYIPITIMPGVGMLVLSTTGQMMALSAEINQLLSNKCSAFQHQIADAKIVQLSRLTVSATLLYIAAALFVLSGISNAIEVVEGAGRWILFCGVGCTFFALSLLIVYSFNTIKIRRKQHAHNHKIYGHE